MGVRSWLSGQIRKTPGEVARGKLFDFLWDEITPLRLLKWSVLFSLSIGAGIYAWAEESMRDHPGLKIIFALIAAGLCLGVLTFFVWAVSWVRSKIWRRAASMTPKPPARQIISPMFSPSDAIGQLTPQALLEAYAKAKMERMRAQNELGEVEAALQAEQAKPTTGWPYVTSNTVATLIDRAAQAMRRAEVASEQSDALDREVKRELHSGLESGTLVATGFPNPVPIGISEPSEIAATEWHFLKLDMGAAMATGGGRDYVGIKIGRRPAK